MKKDTSGKKYITFVLDSFDNPKYQDCLIGDEVFCYSFLDTEAAIENNLDGIWTYDIGHLSFDLLDLNYNIVLAYDGKYMLLEDGMTLDSGKELRKAHNLRRLLIAHAFDADLGIERKIPIPSADSMMDEENRRKYWDDIIAHRWAEGSLSFVGEEYDRKF